MKILITGASGNVGKGMTELLRGKHQLVLHDLNWMATDLPFFQGDIQIGWNLPAAAQGCDLILHTPAWHGIHWKERTETDYWRLNIDGTFYMFQAAVQAGVKKVVFMSSQAWYGHYNKYGFTKVIGEELCEYYWQNHKIRYIAIRPEDLTPWKTFPQYGTRLLYGGVDRRDVLELVRLAIEDQTVTNDWFPALKAPVFSQAEIDAWEADPVAVLEKRVPGRRRLIDKYKLEIKRKPSMPDISKAQAALGYAPRHNFLTFLEELRRLDAEGTVEQQRCPY